MNNSRKNLKTRTFFGTLATVIGAGTMYIALTNAGRVSADGTSRFASDPTMFTVFLIAGAFMLIVGAMVLLLVLASK